MFSKIGMDKTLDMNNPGTKHLYKIDPLKVEKNYLLLISNIS